MSTPPAPDLRHMTVPQLISALAEGQVDSPTHRQATVMLQLRIAEQQAAAVHQQAAAAEQQARAAHAIVAPTRTLARFTIVLAGVAVITLLATIVQVLVARQYVDLTNKLLRIQMEPNVKLDLTALGSDSVEVWNAGFDPVIDLRINPEIVAFTGATPRSRYRWNVGPGRQNQNDWWRIARLSPGDPSQRKFPQNKWQRAPRSRNARVAAIAAMVCLLATAGGGWTTWAPMANATGRRPLLTTKQRGWCTGTQWPKLLVEKCLVFARKGSAFATS